MRQLQYQVPEHDSKCLSIPRKAAVRRTECFAWNVPKVRQSHRRWGFISSAVTDPCILL